MIVQSLSESVVLGQTPIVDNQVWSSNFGITFIFSLMLSAALTINSLYLLHRMRALTLTTMILKTSLVHNTNAQSVGQNIVFDYFVTPSDLQNQLSLHQTIINASNSNWPFLS